MKKIIKKYMRNKIIILLTITLLIPQLIKAETISDVFGVNLHLRNRYYEADWDNAIAKAQDAGVQWAREEFSWDAIEPADNSYNWTQYDSVISKYSDKNIKVMGLLTYSTQWASSNPGSYEYQYYQPDIEAWKDYVYNVTLHYQGQVSAWEIWNEPNTTNFWKNSQEEYITIFTEAAKKIREADPNAWIILGGLSGADASYLDGIYSQIENKGYFNAVAIHPYRLVDNNFNNWPEKSIDGLNTLATDLNNISCIMKKYDDGDKPIWLTEYGHTTYVDGVTEYDQASLLMRGYALALTNPQVQKIFWYTFRDDSDNTQYLESNFGLVKNNLDDKLSLSAFAFLKEKMSEQNFKNSDLVNADVLDNFNKKRGWEFIGSENAEGKIQEDYHDKLKVYYQFKGEDSNSFLPIMREIKLPNKTKALSFRAKGSNDTTDLRVRIQDATGEVFQYNLGYLPKRFYTFHLLLNNPSEFWNGDGDGILDYPLFFKGFVLDDNPDGSEASGNVYFDDLQSSVKGQVFMNKYKNDNETGYLIWTVGNAQEININIDDAKEVRVYSLLEDSELITGNKHNFKIHVATQPKWVKVVE